MTKIADLVNFRRELFFDGSVQIGWFETDPEKRDKASSHFVFHGPEYHGVIEDDIVGAGGFPLIDTAFFTEKVLNALDPEVAERHPISLAIAGWGTGKSHIGLTLATLLSNPRSDIAKAIISNIEAADINIGARLRSQIDSWKAPILVLAINGMGNFDLAGELSRQVLVQLRAHGQNTAPIEELWPRFQQAGSFVERNFDLRQGEFFDRFGKKIKLKEILNLLESHDEMGYQWVNEIHELANGYPIRAVGQESPQTLLQTVCEIYCGDNRPFQSLLIIFDEFGRYLEFAAERPHIAGDAALQQIFEGVQDNSNRCSLLCFIQFELKAYLSRISRNRHTTIQRYITRYDATRKFRLSSNLETILAHLIEKKDAEFLSDYLFTSDGNQEWDFVHSAIKRWLPAEEQYAVWRDNELFRQVIVQGCWPLHPFATWFLCRATDLLQNRSAIAFAAESLNRETSTVLPSQGKPRTISATSVCMGPLVDELIASEEYGHRGALAQAYQAAEQRYRTDFSEEGRHTLLATLIAGKIGLKVRDRAEAHQALCALSGLSSKAVDRSVKELTREYGILEWNERFARYEILGDAIPRSSFLIFLRRKTEEISLDKVEEIFAKQWQKSVPK